ncbi:MAG: hypothetical protein JXR76_10685 [Deltaproteobacteria bacterium]|nr:hypothetical protein [Deltaproteobacteria bacterium]
MAIKYIGLIDNATVREYREYQKRNPSEHRPVIISMMSFLKEIIGLVNNANGIAYEVPGVLFMVRAGNILNADIVSVGVVYRDALNDYVHAES